MSIIVVRYHVPIIYDEAIGVFTDMDTALKSIRMTMLKMGDRRPIEKHVSNDRNSPHVWYVYPEGEHKGPTIYGYVAKVEDFTMFTPITEPRSILDL